MPPLGVFPLVFMTPQSRRDPPWIPKAVLTIMTVRSSLSMVSLFEAEIHVTCNCFWDKEGFRIPVQEPPDSSLAPHTPGTVRVLNKDRRTKEVPGIPPQPHIPLQPSFLQTLCGLLPAAWCSFPVLHPSGLMLDSPPRGRLPSPQLHELPLCRHL